MNPLPPLALFWKFVRFGSATPPLETEEYIAANPPKTRSLIVLSGTFWRPRVGPRERPRQCRGLEKAVGSHELGPRPGPQCRGAGRCQWLQGGPTLHPPKRRRRRGVGCGQAVTPIVLELPPTFPAWWIFLYGVFLPCSHTTNHCRFQSVSNPSDGDQVKQ